MTANNTFEAGAILANRFRVEHVLGAGGMATVYAARHVSLGDAVAVKVMHRHLASTPTLVERFKREAQSGARARGPHSVAVHDVDTLPTGEVMIVMERLAGEDLGQRLKRVGKLAPAEAVQLVLQACEAVGTAHQLGIVHRDIKPSNLFLCANTGGAATGAPFVKVVDFGIARISGASDDRPVTLTQGDAVLGSPFYMAPEQWVDARRVDARADIWSLGATLYKAVTGQVPFPGDSLPEICAAVLTTEAPRASEIDPRIPDGLSDVLHRAMQKDREGRWATVAAFASALGPFAQPIPPGDPRSRSAPLARVPAPSAPSPTRVLESSHLSVSTGLPFATAPATSTFVLSGAPKTSAPPTSSSLVASPRPSKRGLLIGVLIGALVAAGAAIGVLIFLLRGDDAKPRASKAPSAPAMSSAAAAPTASQALAGGPPGPIDAARSTLDQARQGLDQLGQLKLAPPPSTAAAPARPTIDWTKRRVPDLDVDTVTKRLVAAGFKILSSGVDRTPPFDRFQYTIEGFQCTGGALYFRFPTVAEAKQLEQGMAAAPNFRVVRDDKRVVQTSMSSLPTVSPSAACNERVAEALTE